MKNAFLAVGAGIWVAVGGHVAANKYQNYYHQHPRPAVVSASQYKASQTALQQSQAQARALAAQHAALCAQFKVKPKGC